MKIYIFNFPNFCTGGIELLHQTCHALNAYSNIDACIYYITDTLNPQPELYTLRYNNPYTIRTPVEQNAILLFPETMVIYALNPIFQSNRKIIYWESVDNYFTPLPRELWYKFPENTIHLVQSEYAKQFILQYVPSASVLSLTDYLSSPFLLAPSSIDRRPRLTYNARKDQNFTKQLLPYLSNFEIIPLTNYTTEQVINILSSSMLYFDFGNHPGKDRMPREAAMCGCCVIVGDRGAAAFKEDVPILEKYKYKNIETEENFLKIREGIEYITTHYEECSKDFDDYREKIRRERERFDKEIEILVRRLET